MLRLFQNLVAPRTNVTNPVRIAVAATSDALWGVRWSLRPRATPYYEASESLPLPTSFTEANTWETLADRLDGKRAPLYVVLPPSIAKLVQINGPELPVEERRAALTFLAAQAEDRSSDELLLDYVDVPALRRASQEPLAYCAVAQRALVSALIDAIDAAGFHLKTLDIPEQTLRRLLALLAPEKEHPALILYMDDESSLMLVATATQLYLFRTSRIGRRLFASDPASSAMALGLDLQRTLDFYDTQFSDPSPQQIWVIDAVAPNPELVTALANELRLPLTVVTPNHLGQTTEITPAPPLGILALTLGAVLAPIDS